MGVSGQRHAPAALYPLRYPLDKRLGGPQSLSGLEEKSFAPAGDRTPIIQPVVRHYTAWAPVFRILQIKMYKRKKDSILLLSCFQKARNAFKIVVEYLKIRDI
jgi:hypothetical protein